MTTRTLLVLTALLALTGGLSAADIDNVCNPDLDKGFQTIFNGKDLTGWEGHADLWTVTDGVIRGETTPDKKAPGNTFLVWKDGKLKDFVLKLKFRIGKSNNSGVQFRSIHLPAKENAANRWVVKGYQAEVQEKPGKVGFLYDEKRRGWLVNVGDFMIIEPGEDGKKVKKMVVGPIADAKKLIEAGYYKMEDWNEYTITCRGNHIMMELNGHQTMELIDRDEENRTLEGVLALQLHAGAPMWVEYKDIRVKHLDENYGEAQMLFDGDLEGWTYSNDKQKEAWTAEPKGMVLSTSGKPAGYIRTEADHTNYVLRLQMRHERPCNCGVLLRMTGEDKVWPKSIEAQGQKNNMGDIWNIDKFPMKTCPDRTRGRHTRKMHETNEKPVGEWNTYEIYLNKGTLVLKVNGLVQNVATECEEVPGKICFQSEGGPVQFRNVILIPINDKK